MVGIDIPIGLPDDRRTRGRPAGADRAATGTEVVGVPDAGPDLGAGRHLAGGERREPGGDRQGAEPPGLPPVQEDRRGRRVAAGRPRNDGGRGPPGGVVRGDGRRPGPVEEDGRGAGDPARRAARRGPGAAGGPARTRRTTSTTCSTRAPWHGRPGATTAGSHARCPRSPSGSATASPPRSTCEARSAESSSGWMRRRFPDGRIGRSGGRPPPRDSGGRPNRSVGPAEGRSRGGEPPGAAAERIRWPHGRLRQSTG